MIIKIIVILDLLPLILHLACCAKQLYVFSTSPLNWRYYDWNKISTIVQFNFHDDDLINYAHAFNATVHTLGNFQKSILTNSAHINKWVQNQVSSMEYLNYDGINIDFEDEISCDDVDSINGFNYLMKELYTLLKKTNLRYQLTIDFAWSPENIDNRCYDYVTLSKYSDYVFIMSYDERSQIHYECIAWANSAINNTFDGLNRYLKIGVANDKIILGLPWYGYDYPCIAYDQQLDICSIKVVPFRGVNCSDAAGSQKGFSDIMINYLPNATHPILWDEIAKSPYFTFKSRDGLHQMWFDNPSSLKLKYHLAQLLDLHSIGFWEADSLDYSQNPAALKYYQQMWNALP